MKKLSSIEPLRDNVIIRVAKEASQNPEVEPMHDRMLVERMPQATHSGLIFLPETGRQNSAICKVLAVGPGRWEDGYFTKTACKPGDMVIVPGAGNKFPDWEAGQQILIQQADVGAIIG